MTGTTLTEADLRILRRCVDLARTALEAGDEPFGSVLVDGDGQPLAEDRNRAISVDPTRHPEFELARWAAEQLSAPARAAATVYTSGEHCPMCAAAHAWVGIGRIVYAASGAQLVAWSQEWGVPTSPVSGLPASVVAPNVTVQGPAPQFAAELRELHHRNLHRQRT
ncbi:MAG: nucleoside deaminase [Propionibacteriaceae bacterium]